jgi:hypothetical protein
MVATESAEANDPAEPMDWIEPDDPIDRIDPEDPIDRIDPDEPIDRIDPVGSVPERDLPSARMRALSQPRRLRTSRRRRRWQLPDWLCAC